MNKPTLNHYWKHHLMWGAPFLLVVIAGVLSIGSVHVLLVSFSFGPGLAIGFVGVDC